MDESMDEMGSQPSPKAGNEGIVGPGEKWRIARDKGRRSTDHE
jgi:hypothetical protein